MIYGRYTGKPREKEQDPLNINKTARNNFIRTFLFLFIIMVVFMAISHYADAFDPGFNAYPLRPDTDTKMQLEWLSVPNAEFYRIFRYDESINDFTLIKSINVGGTLDPFSYTDQGLKPETTYRYMLVAYDANRKVILSDEATNTTTAMIRPHGLSAVFDVTSRKALLTWKSSALAEGSMINMTENGVSVPPFPLDIPETTSYTVEILGSNPVQFTVRTRSGAYGTSALSDPVTVVPVALPYLTAEYVNESTVKISWGSSTNIDVYVLERSKWDGASWGTWETVSTTLSGTYMTQTVEEGGQYRYRLRAREDKGYTGNSNVTNYVNNLVAPKDLKGKITAEDQIDLSWTNPPGNTGRLEVWRKAGGSSTSGQYTLVGTLNTNDTTFSDKFRIDPGVTYHYRVNAADDKGNRSSYATISITAKVPDAPSSLRASVVSGSGITLLWNDNSNNETSFIIERYDDSQKKYVTIGTATEDSTTYTDNTAVQGRTYIYRVYAYNGMGRSASPSNEVTINAWDAVAPASLDVKPVSPTRLDLTWSYTGSDNYNTIIERKKGVDGTWTTIFTTAAGVLKYSDTGLEPNTRYFYRVRKSLGTGVSGEPFPDESGHGAYTLLPTPTVSAKATSDDTIYISWSGVSNADVVIERKMANGAFSPIMTVGPTVQGWYDNTGIVPGAFYTYRIMAKTATNYSLYSNEITVHSYYLGTPYGLTLSVRQNDEIELRWVDNSTDEAGFEIWRGAYGSGQFGLYATVGKNVTTFIDSKVDRGVQYTYRVRAFSEGGSTYSEFSGTVSGGIGIINPPADLRYEYISEHQIKLRWTDTSDNEYGFIIEQKIGDNGSWNNIAWVSANQTEYIISYLNKYMKYYYRVRTINYSGNADAVSEEILVFTALPGAPSDLQAVSMSSSQIKLKWNDNSDSEKGFRVLRSLYSDRNFYPVAELVKDTTEYYDSGLSAGTRYYYKVEAYNDTGRSESNVAEARTNTRMYFSDIGGVPWAKDAIENLAGMGIIKGKSGTLFMPNDTVTRAEFAVMLVRAFGLETAPVGSLADVRYDKWYYREVMIAENFGIVSGDGNNRFYPERPITREEIAVMVFRALQASRRKYNAHDNSVLEKFIDKNNISPGAVPAMAVLVGEGIMEGMQGSTLGPKYNATRAQAAVFIYRALTKTEPGEAQ